MKENKSFFLEVKAEENDDGTISEFEGDSSGIGNEDLHRDIIAPGAFKKTISEKVSAGKVKLLNNHQLARVNDVLGTVVAAEEREVENKAEGGPTHKLWSKFAVSADPEAQSVVRKAKEGHVTGLSIGYKPITVEYTKDEDSREEDPRWAWIFGEGTRTIKELALFEVSLTPFPANEEAQVIESSLKKLDYFTEICKERKSEIPQRYVEAAVKSLGNLIDMDISPERLNSVKSTIEKLENSTKTLDTVEKDVFVQLINEYKDAQETPSKEHFFMWFTEQVREKEAANVITFTKEAVQEDETPESDLDEKDETPEVENQPQVDLTGLDAAMKASEALTQALSTLADQLAGSTPSEELETDEKNHDVDDDEDGENKNSTSTEVEDEAAEKSDEDYKESLRIALNLADDLGFNI